MQENKEPNLVDKCLLEIYERRHISELEIGLSAAFVVVMMTLLPGLVHTLWKKSPYSSDPFEQCRIVRVSKAEKPYIVQIPVRTHWSDVERFASEDEARTLCKRNTP